MNAALLQYLFLALSLFGANVRAEATQSCSCACLTNETQIYGKCFPMTVRLGPSEQCSNKTFEFSQINISSTVGANLPWLDSTTGSLSWMNAETCPLIHCGIAAADCDTISNNPRANLRSFQEELPRSMPCHLMPWAKQQFPPDLNAQNLYQEWNSDVHEEGRKLYIVRGVDRRGPEKEYWITYRPVLKTEYFSSDKVKAWNQLPLGSDEPFTRSVAPPPSSAAGIAPNDIVTTFEQCVLGQAIPTDTQNPNVNSPQVIYNTFVTEPLNAQAWLRRADQADAAMIFIANITPGVGTGCALRRCLNSNTLRCWLEDFGITAAGDLLWVLRPIRAARGVRIGGHIGMGAIRTGQTINAIVNDQSGQALLYAVDAIIHSGAGLKLAVSPKPAIPGAANCNRNCDLLPPQRPPAGVPVNANQCRNIPIPNVANPSICIVSAVNREGVPYIIAKISSGTQEIGEITLMFEGNFIRFGGIEVVEAFRDRGIGRVLFQEAFATAQATSRNRGRTLFGGVNDLGMIQSIEHLLNRPSTSTAIRGSVFNEAVEIFHNSATPAAIKNELGQVFFDALTATNPANNRRFVPSPGMWSEVGFIPDSVNITATREIRVTYRRQ